MDKEQLHQVLAELAEQGAPASEIDLWPAVRTDLLEHEQTKNLQGEKSMDQPKSLRRRLPAAALLAALALIVIVFLAATPQGQSLAQSVLRFFVPAEHESFSAPVEAANAALTEQAPQPTAAPPPGMIVPGESSCGLADSEAQYACQVAAADADLGFRLKVVPAGSELLMFNAIYIEPQAGRGQISYSYRGYQGTTNSVWLFEGTGRRRTDSDWDKVPLEAVQTVDINGLPGEFVAGGFIVRPGEDQASWNGSVPMARLRWAEGDRWFELFKAGEPDPLESAMDRDGMVRIAAGLVELVPPDETVP